MRVIVEQLVEWRLAGETEALGENLPQRHFVHHKSHMIRPGFEPTPPRWEASDWPLELWRGLKNQHFRDLNSLMWRMTTFCWYTRQSVKSMFHPIGVPRSRKAESNCAVTHTILTNLTPYHFTWCPCLWIFCTTLEWRQNIDKRYTRVRWTNT
jgi:hypothetical protein